MTNEKFTDTAVTEAPAGIQPVFEEMRMNQSPELGKLAEALAKAQLKFTPITKDSSNPAFKRGDKVSKYADFASVLRGTQHALAEEGLVVIQLPTVANKVLVMTSKLLHASGQWIDNELTMPAADDRGYTPHSIGKAITYARRYSYQCLVGATAEEDDDGNEASGVGTKGAADAVAKAKLEENAKSSDPKTAAIAKEGLAKINAVDTVKNLEGQLQRSLEAQKDDGLFDEVKGVIQGVRNMSTSVAKGSKPYRRVAMACFDANNEPYDIEMSLFEDFPLGNSTAFMVLDGAMSGDAGAFTVERRGKYVNIKDIKQIAGMHWSPSVGR